jgi:hypothetical protein
LIHQRFNVKFIGNDVVVLGAVRLVIRFNHVENRVRLEVSIQRLVFTRKANTHQSVEFYHN